MLAVIAAEQQVIVPGGVVLPVVVQKILKISGQLRKQRFDIGLCVFFPLQSVRPEQRFFLLCRFRRVIR